MGVNELENITDVFRSNWIAPAGPDIEKFEKKMCDYTGTKNAVALSSGSAAIHMALKAAKVESGDDVFCSSFTFAGSAFPVTYLNATPVFVDSEKKSWNMDSQLLRDAIKDRIKKNKRPAAVIVVHLYGQSADMAGIESVCKEFNVTLIEDAAESVGAFCGDRHTGTIGEFGIFSFNGNKIITTSGGGMLVGKDASKLGYVRHISTQARDPFPYYEHTTIGYNYRMSNVLAALGCGQLQIIEERVGQRRAIYDIYREALSEIEGLTVIPRDVYGRSNCWLTCIVLDPLKIQVPPESIRIFLEGYNIESRPLWKPMHLQPVFKLTPSYCNGVSETLFNRGLCLPSGSSMSENELKFVISCLKEILFKK